jgi:putative transcriptional regulator
MPKKKGNVKKEHAFSGSDLIAAAAEGLAALQAGRMGDLRTATLELPDPARELKPGQIRGIREKMGASQAVFARLLNVPRGTAIAWESGARRPSGAALKLLHIARRKPEVLIES